MSRPESNPEVGSMEEGPLHDGINLEIRRIATGDPIEIMDVESPP